MKTTCKKDTSSGTLKEGLSKYSKERWEQFLR